LPDPLAETDRLDPAIWKIAAVAIMGSLLAQLDATIVNVSLSSLAVELHSSLETIQWVTSGYLLALALMLPLSGWLVDRIGAKAVYLWCFTAFTLASALCGFSGSAETLIACRVLQGMCGGLLAPMTQLMMARAAGSHMARVMGISAVPILIAPILGPVLAGAILQHASWRWLFLVNLPVGVVAIVLAILLLPGDRAQTRPRELDLAGLALLSPGLVLFLYGSDKLSSPLGIGAFVLGIAFILLFLRLAKIKGDRALIDLKLFQGKVFPVSALNQFLTNGIAFTGQMLIPYFLVRGSGLTPSQAGWDMAPLGLGMMCSFPFMGTLTSRFGIKRLSVTGALLGLIFTLPLIYLAIHGPVPGLLAVSLFFRGAGMGMVGVPSISAAYASVRKEELPMATTTLNIVQRIGGPTSTTICATFLAWRLKDTAPSGAFAAAFALLCLLHGFVFLSALRLPLSIERRAPDLTPRLVEAASD